MRDAPSASRTATSRSRAVADRRRRVEDPGTQRLQMRRRTLDRPARTQAPHHADVEQLAPQFRRLTHGHRDIEALAHGEPEEAGWRDADDLVPTAVDGEAQIAHQLTATQARAASTRG